ncbi:MAG: hypothetical protein RR054_05995 [Clostridia bacterium]
MKNLELELELNNFNYEQPIINYLNKEDVKKVWSDRVEIVDEYTTTNQYSYTTYSLVRCLK